MTARQQRRHEERIARKKALKADKQLAATQAPATSPDLGSFEWLPETTFEPAGFESQKFSRAAVDKEKTHDETAVCSKPKIQGRSTGPRTPEGKAISSKNNFRHGLAGAFAVLEWEDADRYGELLFQLHQEHHPETMTEYILVERMAQHQWLSQRALHLQNFCFNMDVPVCEQEKQLALYLRYGTTHDRAFHKCLADLLKLRAHKTKEQREFESQKSKQAAETRKQELHQLRLRTAIPRPAPPKAPAKQTLQPAAGPHLTAIPSITEEGTAFERRAAA